MAIVIMGVSGAGKSTIGNMLARVINCPFIDADDFHHLSNKEKMRNNIPLSNEDRIPWLETLRDVLRDNLVNTKTLILGCSALRRPYREILRSADPKYKLGSSSPSSSSVRFVLLEAKAELLVARLEERAAKGEHFMGPSLLQSQLETLEIDDSEGIHKVDASLGPQVIIGSILEVIGYEGL